MFCPLCKTEYRKGFYTCADCSVPLVAELQKEEESKGKASEMEFIEIISTRNPAELAFIKSLFDAEDVTYYVVGEQMMTSPMLSGGGPARLYVASVDIDCPRACSETLNLKNLICYLGYFVSFKKSGNRLTCESNCFASLSGQPQHRCPI